MFAVPHPLQWGTDEEVMGVPAWKALPSWFMIAHGRQQLDDVDRIDAPRPGLEEEAAGFASGISNISTGMAPTARYFSASSSLVRS